MSLKQQRGFSLVETMAVAAILGITVLAVASLSRYLQKTSNYADRRSGISSLERMISQRLDDQGLCLATLGSGSGMGNHIAPSGPSPVRLNMPNLQVSGSSDQTSGVGAGSALSAMKLNVLSLQLQNAQNVTGNEWVADLYLQTSDVDHSVYKDELVSAVIMTVSGGVIQTCHANSAQDSQQVCTDMGCTFNANATPNCQCTPTTLTPCTRPQQYPVSYDVNGTPTCRGLGDSTNCPANQYLTGVQLQHKTCAALITPTPTPGPTASPTPSPTATVPPSSPTPSPTPNCQWLVTPTMGLGSPYTTAELNLDGSAAMVICPGFSGLPPLGQPGEAWCSTGNVGATHFCGPGMGGTNGVKGNIKCQCF